MPRTTEKQAMLNHLDSIICTAAKKYKLSQIFGATVEAERLLDFISMCQHLHITSKASFMFDQGSKRTVNTDDSLS